MDINAIKLGHSSENRSSILTARSNPIYPQQI